MNSIHSLFIENSIKTACFSEISYAYITTFIEMVCYLYVIMTDNFYFIFRYINIKQKTV